MKITTEQTYQSDSSQKEKIVSVFQCRAGQTYEIEEETVGLRHKRETFKHVEGQKDEKIAEDQDLRADSQTPSFLYHPIIHPIEEQFKALYRVKDFVLISSTQFAARLEDNIITHALYTRLN